MSQFINVYHIVFGGRPAIIHECRAATEDEEGDLCFSFTPMPEEKPIDVTKVVCAIEMCKTYHYDDFGRFGVANDEAKEKIKAALAKYSSEMVFRSMDEVDELYSHVGNLTNMEDWIGFGWLHDDLPDFEACYEQWKVANGMDGIHAPPVLLGRQAPSSQSHLWKLMNQLLKLVVGDEAHQLIKKDDYKTAISTLESKGLRWAENEKKALRRNLKTIVTNVQQ